MTHGYCLHCELNRIVSKRLRDGDIATGAAVVAVVQVLGDLIASYDDDEARALALSLTCERLPYFVSQTRAALDDGTAVDPLRQIN